MVTSRIIGYEAHPLRDTVAKFTIERLSERSIVAFSRAWHGAYFARLAESAESAAPAAPAAPEPGAAGAAQAEGAAEAAEAANHSFIGQIFHPSRAALRELVSNPLMLALLCIVVQEHGQALPESRAQLYELVVKRGLDALFLDRRRSNRGLAEVVRRTLIAIATRMHATTSNGLLPAAELREVVAGGMAGEAAGGAGAEDHFRMIVEGVGLLSERGTRQYGFRHQTIQEYLAGLQLGEVPERAASGCWAGRPTRGGARPSSWGSAPWPTASPPTRSPPFARPCSTRRRKGCSRWGRSCSRRPCGISPGSRHRSSSGSCSP